MATGLVNGTDLIIQVGSDNTNDTAVAYATSCSLEISMDEIDQTNKDSEGWKSIIGGTRSWSISSDQLYQNESLANHKGFTEFWANLGGASERTPVYVQMMRTGTLTSNNKIYHGSAYVTSLSVNGGTEDQATFSVTLTGTGKLEEADGA
jgi:TP901-1 family phage major tail protein